jgi:CRISPR/Cas system CMR subunit Cmr6 (Cas7 group RAMP superfamily)
LQFKKNITAMTANKEQIKGIIDSFNLPDFSKATIREIVGIGKKIEAETGMRMARMEMGVPGVPASEIGVNAEIDD